ncbi:MULTISPECIES: XopAP family type III secretion system effector [Xanthomonas]|uniref:Lipase n=1 Tax=Xanthomonas phaseoli pv. dieffenbachiae TaxID=92828 RepID=A0A1V9HAZ6_9XANT|nr:MULTISPECIES: XopAP family type III secretion system effector [Xanthomonas]MBO9790329.1 lipase [Xanthomonas phaseoli pv. dieffenbachiae]MBO9887948.1 lipase [Xanthomonas phaseoli pv. dieffenbachiae]MBO9916537.1 lipase [Xanthomonas phaseoli pv. dieffenbachiae]MBO9940917.1 lipase [Xanthomonas phaseoli pv. dieffenbachiae]MBO9996991.1 lipase [Xanthomonas phaseoli pv. dieffenbachiae]
MSLLSIPHAKTVVADVGAPVSVTASPCQVRDSAGAFAGLNAAPVKRIRKTLQSIVAKAERSCHVPLLQIDAQTSDLASAIAQVDGASAQSSRQDEQWEMHCRVVLECMRACAGESYTADLATVADIGGLHLDAPMSTPRLKLWEGATDDAIVVVLGFSGTRLDATNDLLCDMRSQIAQPHVNILDERLPALGKVGAGWQEWWHSEAQLPRAEGAIMKDVLIRYSNLARDSGKALLMSLTGHSLGASGAMVAGFDIAHFLRAAGASGKVSVYAFNPPRLGQAGIVRRYRDSLTSERSALHFTLRQFTRTLDPIQSMPFFMHHPHWNQDRAATGERAGSASGDRFAQFVTITDQPASRINLADNHELTVWGPYFLSKIEQAKLQRIFSPVEVSEGTSGDSRLSRRQLFVSFKNSLTGL